MSDLSWAPIVIEDELPVRVTGADPRVPSLGVVFREQLRLISMAGVGSMGFMVLGGVTMMFLGMDARIARLPFPIDYLPLGALLLGAVAWPPLVWRGQGPTRRGYHRTQPVDQLTHDLLKIGAGAVWLMLGVGVVLLTLLLCALTSPYLRDLVTGPPPWVWVNFFTGPLLVYLLLSAVPMLTDKPLEWMLGLTGAFVGVQALASTYRIEPLYTVLSEIVRSPIGLATALHGAYSQVNWEVYAHLGGGYPRETYGEWIGATVIWFLLATLAIYVASTYANSRKS